MKPRHLLALALWAAAIPAACAADGAAWLVQACAACHRLAGPPPQTLAQLWARKGPDLSYAGNKFQEPWLRAWLQKPQRLRPAGVFYGEHIKPGPQRDEIDTSGLAEHPVLAPDEAARAAAALMELREGTALVDAEHIEPGTISRAMGEMAFDKFLGCIACHRIEPNYGGVSGPELYTAGRRLRPAFIASYLRSPQAWDPKTWMPNKHLNDANIQKMVRYLQVLASEDAGAH